MKADEVIDTIMQMASNALKDAILATSAAADKVKKAEAVTLQVDARLGSMRDEQHDLEAKLGRRQDLIDLERGRGS